MFAIVRFARFAGISGTRSPALRSHARRKSLHPFDLQRFAGLRSKANIAPRPFFQPEIESTDGGLP